MVDNMLPMLYETAFGILALFILTKVLGKTQISQLTAFDFIAALVLGELVGNALFDKKAGLLDIGYVILLWGVILYVIEIITQKFGKTRHLLEGDPVLIIHKGMFIREELKKNKMDVDEVQQLLRAKDVFSVAEVEYAILETDGTLSVLKKSAYQTPTKKDLNVAPSKVFLPTKLISDGEIIEDNLEEEKLTEGWLRDELSRQGFDKVEDVFYAEYTEGQKLLVLPIVNLPERESD